MSTTTRRLHFHDGSGSIRCEINKALNGDVLMTTMPSRVTCTKCLRAMNDEDRR